jgi:hypothetical protein
MNKKQIIGILLVQLLLPFLAVKAQPLIADSADQSFFLRKETITQIFLHTAGFGFGYAQGKHITVNQKNIWEVELLNQLSPKEIRSVSPWAGNTKSYVYGKENYFFAIRGGIGRDKLLNRKPYWGGIEVRYFYRAGLSMGFVKPVYLDIINYTPGYTDYYLTTEQYDPDKHFYDNIYGRAPFLKGFDVIQLRPGIYGKFGFNFDFGAENDRVKCLEAGAMFDYYPNSIPFIKTESQIYKEGIIIMSYNPAVDGFFGFYLGFKWGKRFNKNQASDMPLTN